MPVHPQFGLHKGIHWQVMAYPCFGLHEMFFGDQLSLSLAVLMNDIDGCELEDQICLWTIGTTMVSRIGWVY